MKPLLPIEIHGAGLAGMGLALLLTRRGIPVQVIDRSTGPQHRVCGEFMRGLSPEMINRFELSSFLQEASQNRTVEWFFQDRSLVRFELPQPVYSVGRPQLESHLLRLCQQSGVEFFFREKREVKTKGAVIATGRRKSPDSDWFGFKIHLRNISLSSDLEMHLSPHGYVGLSRVEKEWTNVSGIFKANSTPLGGSNSLDRPLHRMQRVLNRMGFSSLSTRLESGEEEEESLRSTSGIVFGLQKNKPNECAIGDAFAFIPPFSGSGMSMALQGSLIAREGLERYSKGESTWRESCRKIRHELRWCFSKKLFFAQGFHHLMSSSLFQPSLIRIAKSGYFPVKPILWGIS